MFAQATNNQWPEYWLHDLSPFIIRFSENFGLRWYGMAYVLGFLAAYGLLAFYYKKGRSPWDADQQATAFWAIILGVVVGGRLGYMLFYDWGNFMRNPLIIIRVWEGGMASHGGFVGSLLAGIWFARRSKTPFLKTADIFCTLPLPGIFFGRIANFINGELWGKVTEVPWAVLFPASPYPLSPRHPSQLYEALLEGLLLCLYTQIRFWTGKPQKRPEGQLCGELFLVYALVRILGEAFREPDAALIFGLSRGVFYSLFLAAGGIGMNCWARRKGKYGC